MVPIITPDARGRFELEMLSGAPVDVHAFVAERRSLPG